MSDADLPQPGTEAAIAIGCTCDYRDGELSDNDQWPDWLTRGCPVHDDTPARPDLSGIANE